MTPTLGIDRVGLNDNGFINAYQTISNREYDKNHVFLLFKPDSFIYFQEFLDNQYEKNSSIVEDFDLEGGYVVLVYKLDENLNKDFNFVREGKYSKTSEEFQSLFPKVIKMKKNNLYKDEISLQYRIFNKTDDLKKYWEDKLGVDFRNEMEVWEGWDDSIEHLNIETLK